MKTNEKKVVFLNGVNSPYIEQAIFVLKKKTDADKMQSGIVLEAERIVAQYAKSHLAEEEDDDQEMMGGFSIDHSTLCHESPIVEFTGFSPLERAQMFLKRNRVLIAVLMASIFAFGGIMAFCYFLI